MHYRGAHEAPAEYSDETKVDRRSQAHRSGPLDPCERELSTVVEAVVGADLGSDWIAPLRRAAGPNDPMNWDHVADFVLRGFGTEAEAARNGLGAQPLVVTDQMHAIRRLDLGAAADGKVGMPFGGLLLTKSPNLGIVSASLRPDANVKRALQRFVMECTLDSSGLGLLCDHMASADNLELDGNIRGRRTRSGEIMDSLILRLDGSLTKAARLASKATALAVPLIDPDHPQGYRVRQRHEAFSEDHWGGHDWMLAQEALGVVAERRLVVDSGHQDITDLTADLRDMAEVHSHGPDFNRQQAFDSLRDARSEMSFDGRGFVRAGDDRRDLLLQVADVAAGWGRTLISTHGYVQLKHRFRCVLYHGTPLTAEKAARLDDELVEHRKYVESYLRGR